MFKEGCTFRQLCSFRGCYLFGFLGKPVVFFSKFLFGFGPHYEYLLVETNLVRKFSFFAIVIHV